MTWKDFAKFFGFLTVCYGCVPILAIIVGLFIGAFLFSACTAVCGAL